MDVPVRVILQRDPVSVKTGLNLSDILSESSGFGGTIWGGMSSSEKHTVSSSTMLH